MKHLILTLYTMAFLSCCCTMTAETIPLDGIWRFAPDPQGQGESEAWFERRLTGSIRLPGELNSQGIGNEIGLATPWIGGITDKSFFTDSRYEPYRKKGNVEAAGQRQLTVRVENSMVIDIGENSHSVSDHTQQSNWNGIVGKMLLQARSPVRLEDIRIFSDIESKTIRVKARLRNPTGLRARGKVSLEIHAGKGVRDLGLKPITVNFDTPADREKVELVYELGKYAQAWDEFSPAVYHAKFSVGGEWGGKQFADTTSVAFGLREISRE